MDDSDFSGGEYFDINGDKPERGKNTCGLIFKFALVTIFLVLFCFIGGTVDRIRGGFLNVPDFNTTSEVNGANIIARDLGKRLLWSVPLGLITTLAMDEPRLTDPYFLRRTGAGVFVTLSSLLSIYVSWDTYYQVGRDANNYNSEIGVFDWVLGHECQNSTFQQRWAIEFSGMSLRGLVQTVPAGLLLFTLGFGPDYFFSGLLMSLAYEAGQDLQLDFLGVHTGSDFGAFLWGSYTWLVLLAVILAFRSHGQHSLRRAVEDGSVIRRVLWYLGFAFLLAIFIGSSASYGQVEQADMIGKYQTWIGIIASTALFGAQLLVTLVIKPLVFRAKDTRISSVDYEPLPSRGVHDHPELSGLVEDEFIIGRPRATIATRLARWLVLFFLPKGDQPYRAFVVVVRLINILAIIVNVPLLVYVIITSRIMQPCQIQWNQ